MSACEEVLGDDDLLVLIFSRMTVRTLLNMEQCCKAFRRVMNENQSVWRSVITLAGFSEVADLEGVSSFRAVYKSVMMGMHQREKRTMIQGLDDLQFMLRVEHLKPPTVGERVEVHDFWGGEWHAGTVTAINQTSNKYRTRHTHPFGISSWMDLKKYCTVVYDEPVTKFIRTFNRRPHPLDPPVYESTHKWYEEVMEEDIDPYCSGVRRASSATDTVSRILDDGANFTLPFGFSIESYDLFRNGPVAPAITSPYPFSFRDGDRDSLAGQWSCTLNAFRASDQKVCFLYKNRSPIRIDNGPSRGDVIKFPKQDLVLALPCRDLQAYHPWGDYGNDVGVDVSIELYVMGIQDVDNAVDNDFMAFNIVLWYSAIHNGAGCYEEGLEFDEHHRPCGRIPNHKDQLAALSYARWV